MSYTSNLFDEAVGTVYKSISRDGKTKVKPAPSLADAHFCRPYHLVVKRNKKWFWKHSKYFPQAFKISNILTKEGKDFEEKETTQREFSGNFKRHIKLDADGELALSIAQDLVGVELDANHHIDVSVNFGRVLEDNLDVPGVCEALKEKKLDMKNSFIQETMKESRHVLCMIVTSFTNEKSSTVSIEIKGGGSGSVNVDAGTAVPVSGKLAVNAGTENVRSIKIPANTPLSYRLNEMIVNADGSIQLLQIPGSKGGFKLNYAKIRDTTPDLAGLRKTVEQNISIGLDSLLEGDEMVSDEDRVEVRRHMQPVVDLQDAKEKNDFDYLSQFFEEVHPYAIEEKIAPICERWKEDGRDRYLLEHISRLSHMQHGYRSTWDECRSHDFLDVERAVSVAGDRNERAEMETVPRLQDGGQAGLRRGLIDLLNRPVLLDRLNNLVEMSFNALLVGEGGKLTPKESVQEQLGCAELDDAIKSVLQVAGFQFQENDVKFPSSEDRNSIDYVNDVLDLLTPLNKEQRKILMEMSDEQKQMVVKVVSGALSPEGLPMGGESPGPLFHGSERAKKLVMDMGFKSERIGGNWALVYRGVIGPDELNPFGLLAIMSYMWGIEK